MIKKVLILSAFCALACDIYAASEKTAATSPALSETGESKPNVIIIYGDDVGFGDVGAYGSKLIPTPNIDQLASEGIRFTDGHCSSATCTPSRYSMLTGVHGFRDEVQILPPNAPLSISTDVLTLPKLFQKSGYSTGIVGKWHLDLGEKGIPTDWNGEVKPGPLEIGFDSSFLLPSTNDRVPCVYLEGHRVVNLDPNDSIFVGRSKQSVDRPGRTIYPDGKKNKRAMTYYQSTQGHNNSVINGIGRIGYMSGGKSALWDDETMTDEFVKQAKKFIAKNKDAPFFLYFASQSIHVPRAPNKRFQGTTILGYRGDAMVEFDWAVGELMKTLEEYDLTENTVVIFSSDNGPVYDDGYADGTVVDKSSEEIDRDHDGSGIYRGGKYQIYEGGTRVPFIIRWPTRIEPGVSDGLVNQIDFIASFAELLNVDLAAKEARDSRSTLKTFLGDVAVGHNLMLEEANVLALREGDWKYIEKQNVFWAGLAQAPLLYNLAEDPSEQTNLIEQYPEKAASMAKMLEKMKLSEGIRKMSL